MNENIRRFTQANVTPPLLPETIAALGWTADTQLSQDILSGNDTTTIDVHPGIHRLIPYLSTPQEIISKGPISLHITREEYKHSWKRTREFTTTGRSGLHFGHMKASCQDEQTSDTDRLFLMISLESGYSLRRWHQGIDFCIPKKEDSIQVDKMRTICFLECDFNHMNKILAQRLMMNA
jgi:hypothetical protein